MGLAVYSKSAGGDLSLTFKRFHLRPRRVRGTDLLVLFALIPISCAPSSLQVRASRSACLLNVTWIIDEEAKVYITPITSEIVILEMNAFVSGETTLGVCTLCLWCRTCSIWLFHSVWRSLICMQIWMNFACFCSRTVLTKRKLETRIILQKYLTFYSDAIYIIHTNAFSTSCPTSTMHEILEIKFGNILM